MRLGLGFWLLIPQKSDPGAKQTIFKTIVQEITLQKTKTVENINWGHELQSTELRVGGRKKGEKRKAQVLLFFPYPISLCTSLP